MEINEIIKLFSCETEENKYLIDHYPHRVSDNDKFVQVECGYNFKGHVRRQQYYGQEKRIIGFLTYLWLYSDMKIYLTDLNSKLINLYMNKILKYNAKNGQCSFDVCKKKQLDFAGKIICRDCGSAYILCENFLKQEDIFFYCSECTAVILINNKDTKNEVEKITQNWGLFLRKYENHQSY